jgi:tetratricopeptide (TPR) repeat protein
MLRLVSFSFGVLAIVVPARAQEKDNLSPRNVSQLLRDGYDALQRKDWAAARDASLKATEVAPRNSVGWSYLAKAYQNLADLPKAVEAYKTAIELNPQDRYAYNNLGTCYRRMGRIDEALAMFRHQLEVTPRDRYATYNLALALGSQSGWEEALPWASIAAEAAPQEIGRWTFLGKAQIKTGHLDEARNSFDRALALPHEPATENSIAYVLGDAGIDLDRAWRLISQALEAKQHFVCEPASLADGDKCTEKLRSLSFMLDTAGWILYRQGKIKDAEAYLQAAFGITPDSANQLHLAVVFANTNRLDQGVRFFAQAHMRSDFARADATETIRELAKAAGGEAELDTLVSRVRVQESPRVDAKAIVLVDASGKVLDARGFAGADQIVKSMKLAPTAWPGVSLRTIRTIEFLKVNGQWTPSDSYVGVTPPPPPCATARPREITDLTPVAQSISCSAL